MMTLSALNQFLKQHTPEETQRLNGVKKDYSQFPVARGKFDTPCYRFDTNLEDLRSLFLSKNQKIYDAGEETVVYKISVNGEIKIEDFSKRDLTEIQLRNRVNSAIKDKISTQFKN